MIRGNMMFGRIFGRKKKTDTEDFKRRLGENGYGGEEVVLSENISVTTGMPSCGQLVIGKTGTGKTSRFTEPNIRSSGASFVVTDISGDLYRRHAGSLEGRGYAVKHLDLVHFRGGHYNPFAAVRSERDIEDLAETVIMNTVGTEPDGDPVSVSLEKALLQALMGYLCFCTREEDRTFSKLNSLLTASELRLAGGRTALDSVFDGMKDRKENEFAKKQYRVYRTGAGENAYKTAASCAARLHAFSSGQVPEMTGSDDMDILSLGKKKTAVFITLPVAAGPAARSLASMLATQSFWSGKEKDAVPIRIYLDGTEGRIRTPAIMRDAGSLPGASAGVTIQSVGQLKEAYPNEWEDIIRGFGTIIVFGGGMDEAEAVWLSGIMNERAEGGRGAASVTPSKLRRLPFGSCCIAGKGLGICADKTREP